jgi:hypothetical protein
MRLDDLIVAQTFAEVMSSSGERVALQIDASGNMVTVSWPATAMGFRLQGNPGVAPDGWMDESDLPAIEDGKYVVRLPRGAGMHLFRLIK